MWRWSWPFTPGQHEALTLAAVAFIQDMIFNDFELVEEAVMQAIERIGVGDDMGQDFEGSVKIIPCASPCAGARPIEQLLRDPSAKVLALQNVEPGIRCSRDQIPAEIVEVADETVTADREMLAEGRPGKLRGKTLWKAQVLREPAEAARVSEIEMKPKQPSRTAASRLDSERGVGTPSAPKL